MAFNKTDGLTELNEALTYFVEGEEEKGIATLGRSVENGNRIAVLLHHVKGLQPPLSAVTFEKPLTKLQSIELDFWNKEYDEAFKKALNAVYSEPEYEKGTYLYNETKAFLGASWFMECTPGHWHDLDKVWCYYDYKAAISDRPDFAIEKAIVSYWNGLPTRGHNITSAKSWLSLVKDPEFLLTAEMLILLFDDPNFCLIN